MNQTVDPVELARELAKIASTTNDPATAQRLLQLIERLVSIAGLPPE
ncbi:MAG TPA: hypothetical protein VMB34_05060 [Acetobacteraceae bacterium]|nr:hypothetical protein [Acetobacteraceae bacterium]